MTTATREIVTLDNLRIISRTRSLAYGITLMAMGALEILWYGSTDSKLHTTIQFGYNKMCIRDSP